jgi:hypothetical protein
MMRAILLAALAACSSSKSTPDGPLDCSAIPGTDTFAPGLPKNGASDTFNLKLMTISPAPPARLVNSWVVEVDWAATGMPVDGASLTVTPYMPSHGHPSPEQVIVTPASASGQYNLSPVFFSMPGVWTTTIETMQGTAADSSVYTFCIPN